MTILPLKSDMIFGATRSHRHVHLHRCSHRQPRPGQFYAENEDSPIENEESSINNKESSIQMRILQ